MKMLVIINRINGRGIHYEEWRVIVLMKVLRVRIGNALQVTPRDLISIFQALKANGALRAALRIL